jgi:ATP-dependent Clp protease ATP-binding subunit ClpA
MAICDLEMKKLIDRLAESDYILKVDSEVKELIVSKCDLKYGARDLQRNIIRYIEDEICNELLNISDVTKKKIKVSLDKKDSEAVKVKFS